MPSATAITRDEFDALLAEYPSLIASTSASKPAKKGAKTLLELDEYRYTEAPRLFSGAKPERELDLEAIKTLVEWKLRHGKFRPTLMSLVSSNDASAAAELAAQAREAYFTRTGSAGSAADCAELLAAGLRGVGPATASLLMAVMDPAGAIFFSDEAFAWLCGDAKPRYSAGEYRDLLRRAEGLKTRLGVGATEIEQVAYVAVRTGRAGEAGLSEDKTSGQAKGEVAKGKAQGKAATKATPKDKGESTVEAKDEPDTAKDSKRKAEAKTDAPLRRSKRTRA